MATRKSSADTVKLTHTNGATVSVSAEKADRLVAGGMFAPAASKSAKSAGDNQ